MKLYCHHCKRFIYAPPIIPHCPLCKSMLDTFEPHHVLRGRCCPGDCGSDVIVIFRPTTNTPAQPRCPVCSAVWPTRPIERSNVIYEPVVRRALRVVPRAISRS